MNHSFSAGWSVISVLLRKHKWATVAVSFFVLLTFFISIFPVVISSQLQKWLLANGAEEVSIENVDFNPFTAELAVYDVLVRRQGAETLKLESLHASMLRLPLFDRRVVIPHVLINGLSMSVDLSDPAEYRFAGISVPVSSPQPEEKTQSDAEWSLLLSSLRLENHHYAIKRSALKSDIRIDRLNIDNLDTARNADAFTVDLQAALNGSSVNLSGKVSVFVEQPGFEGDLSVHKLDVTPFLPEVDKTFENNALVITLDNALKLKQTDASRLSFNLSGSTLVEHLKWIQPDMTVQAGAVSWDGQVNLQQSVASGLEITAKGKLDNDSLQSQLVQQDMRILNASLAWQGQFSVAKKESELKLASQADVVLSGLEVNRLSEQQTLLTVDHIDARDMQIKSMDEIQIEQLTADHVIAGKQENSALFEQQQLVIDQLSYSASEGVAIRQIMPAGIKADLLRSDKGEWNFEQLLASPKQDSQSGKPDEKMPQQAAAKESSTVFPVRIEKIVLKDGAEVAYNDLSLADGFKQQLNIKSFEIQNIDNTENISSPFTIKAQVDKASIDIEGDVSLFAGEPVFDLKGNIKALSMLPYSRFMERMLGYQVDSGILSAQGKFKGADGKLESETELTLHQLDIKPLTEAQLKKLGAKQDSGLETGLSMLKDKNDTIEIKLPVNGEFDNLKVDPGDIINQALGSALKSGAKTYFAAALFPFGTLLVIADAASDKAMQVSLDPVIFSEGTGEFDQKYHEYLHKVAGILEEKPEIYVKVCGVASASDRAFFVTRMKQEFIATQKKAEATGSEKQEKQKQTEFTVDEKLLSDKLTELAKLRAAKISDFMINNAAVKAGRLVDCQPRLELENQDSFPRADLLL